MHLILIGDSVFDNGAYVPDGPAVCAQVRALLPHGDRVSLLAVDGSTTDQVAAQLQSLPDDAGCLVLSTGGNDALLRADILQAEVRTGAEAFLLLEAAVRDFECAYRAAGDTLLVRGLPLVLCTVYDANFEDRDFQRCVRVAVAAYDDVIIRVAAEHHLCVIDLRAVCREPADFANAIEPSAVGGAKIAGAVVRACALAREASPQARLLA